MSFKTILWSILGLTLLPIIGDYFVELARQSGLYEDPQGDIQSLMTVVYESVEWVIGFRSNWMYPYVLGGSIGLVIGSYLDRRSRSRTPRRNKTEELAARCGTLSAYLTASIDDPRNLPRLLSEYDILANDIDALRLAVSFQRDRSKLPKDAIRDAVIALQTVQPFLEKGRLKEFNRQMRQELLKESG
ncbi:hypothetical protein N9L47_10260 [Rhodobacteraceae bacterium]|nr:hypothetical protein [Paracoccaceae bacterium]